MTDVTVQVDDAEVSEADRAAATVRSNEAARAALRAAYYGSAS